MAWLFSGSLNCLPIRAEKEVHSYSKQNFEGT